MEDLIKQLKCGGKVSKGYQKGGRVEKKGKNKGPSTLKVTRNKFRPISSQTFARELAESSFTPGSMTYQDILNMEPEEQIELVKGTNNAYKMSMRPGKGNRPGAWEYSKNYPIRTKRVANEEESLDEAKSVRLKSRKKERKYEEGGSVVTGKGSGGSGMEGEIADQIIGTGTDAVTSILDELSKKNAAKYDYRENPSEMLGVQTQIDNQKTTYAAMGAGASTGAAIGTAFTPGVGTAIGAGIGAGVGALSANIHELTTSKRKANENRKRVQDWSDAWAESNASNSVGYQKGGEVEKKGSDKKNSLGKIHDPTDKKTLGQQVSDIVNLPHSKDPNLWAKNLHRMSHMADKYEMAGVAEKLTTEAYEKNPNLSYMKDLEVEPKSFTSVKNLETGAVNFLPAYHGKQLVDYKNNKKYKEGGKIKGKGTGTSDSVKMKADDGSFIVPADNAKEAIALGKEYLDWDDNEIASRSEGDTGIQASNGEVLFTPEEVGTLEYFNVDLNALAPDADQSKKMADGGFVYDKKRDLVISEDGTVAYDREGRKMTFENGEKNIDESDIEAGREIFMDTLTAKARSADNPAKLKGKTKPKKVDTSTLKGINIEDNSSDDSDGDDEQNESPGNELSIIAGAAQAAGAVAGIIDTGKEPDLNVSTALKRLSAETRRDVATGLPANLENSMYRDIERTRRDTTNAIVGRGGSNMDVNTALTNLLSETNKSKMSVKLADFAEKSKAKDRLMRIGLAESEQEFAVDRFKYDRWMEKQGMFADLLKSGVSNIIGAQQYKNQLDFMRETGSSSPTFTINTEK